MGYLDRGRDIYKKNGLRELVIRGVAFLHKRIVRPRLPGGDIPKYNDVKIGGLYAEEERRPKLFDSTVPWETPDAPHKPEYESILICSIREQVSEGDSVIVVGGGRGVSTVVAAECASPDGTVTCYEGSIQFFRVVQNTLSLNDCSGICDVQHAVVGTEKNVWGVGETDRAKFVSASEVPSCDVLILDCEGAELDIISGLSAVPSIIIVETHPEFDSATSDVENALLEQGYTITDKNEDLETGHIIVAALTELSETAP
jgi:hypothetical protein